MQTTIALPSIASQAALEVMDQVLGDQLDALLRADKGLERGPFGLELFLVLDLLALGRLLKSSSSVGRWVSSSCSFASRLS